MNAKIKTPEKRGFPNYSQKCGVCKKCTIPNYLKSLKVVCPECGHDQACIASAGNPMDNGVICSKCNNRYDIREQMDLADIELHQRTLRIKQGFPLNYDGY